MVVMVIRAFFVVRVLLPVVVIIIAVIIIAVIFGSRLMVCAGMNLACFKRGLVPSIRFAAIRVVRVPYRSG